MPAAVSIANVATALLYDRYSEPFERLEISINVATGEKFTTADELAAIDTNISAVVFGRPPDITILEVSVPILYVNTAVLPADEDDKLVMVDGLIVTNLAFSAPAGLYPCEKSTCMVSSPTNIYGTVKDFFH